MSDYRRYRIAGGSYFFTVKTENNSPVFANAKAVQLLGQVVRETQVKWPFEIPAIVLLPDHLHTIWTLPGNDFDYSKRWGWLKKEFTKRFLENGGIEQPTTLSRQRNRRRGIWQRRYWEHLLSDDEDFDRYFDYIHWNPVKHGYAASPADWKHSSFHRWVAAGVYDCNWGRGRGPVMFLEAAGE